MTKTILLDNINKFNNVAADVIKESIDKLLLKQDTVVFGIPGGNSVSGIFNKLKKKKIEWEKVHIFMVDERLVPIDNSQSNFKLAKENFIQELLGNGSLKKKNIHPFIIGNDYEAELKKIKDFYDIVLLSSGEDCHIGALYPNHHSIKDDSDFFIIMRDSPKQPKDRMTLSRKLLLKSKVAILLFLGKTKKDAYKKFKNDKVDINSCPAKLILSIKDSYVLINFNN